MVIQLQQKKRPKDPEEEDEKPKDPYRAVKEGCLLLVVVAIAIVLASPQGRYFLWNSWYGHGDKEGLEAYLTARHIPFEDIQRRNIGVTRACVATFKTDYVALKKVIENKDCLIKEAGPSALEVEEVERVANSKPADQRLYYYVNILRLPPVLPAEEKDVLGRAYMKSDLKMYREQRTTLPPDLKWAECRLFVRPSDRQAWLFYAK